MLRKLLTVLIICIIITESAQRKSYHRRFLGSRSRRISHNRYLKDDKATKKSRESTTPKKKSGSKADDSDQSTPPPPPPPTPLITTCLLLSGNPYAIGSTDCSSAPLSGSVCLGLDGNTVSCNANYTSSSPCLVRTCKGPNQFTLCQMNTNPQACLDTTGKFTTTNVNNIFSQDNNQQIYYLVDDLQSNLFFVNGTVSFTTINAFPLFGAFCKLQYLTATYSNNTWQSNTVITTQSQCL